MKMMLVFLDSIEWAGGTIGSIPHYKQCRERLFRFCISRNFVRVSRNCYSIGFAEDWAGDLWKKSIEKRLKGHSITILTIKNVEEDHDFITLGEQI